MTTLILLRQGEQARATPVAQRPATTAPPTTTTTTLSPAAIPAPPPVANASVPGPAFAPIAIRIDKIGASAPVDPMGLNADGSLEVPTDFQRAGYYTGRPPPGAVGPAIIVAHVDSKTGPAVFYRLRDLRPGDEVVVTRTDRSEVVFVVDRLERHRKSAFPTKAVYSVTPGATLRLITCGGTFDRKSGHYRDNLIAFAHLKGLVV
jgi:hypothetical protein